MKPNYRLFLEQVQQGLIDLDEAADALEAQAKEIAELKVNNHALKDVVSFEKKRSADYKSLCDQLAAKKDGSIKFDPEAVLELITRLRAAEKDAARYHWLRNPDQDVGNVIDKRIGTPHDITGVWEYRAGDELDNAIDDAMKEKP